MNRARFAAAGALMVTIGAGCGRAASPGVADGVLLVALEVEAADPTPDELRVSVYDDRGVLFRNVRMPEKGPLRRERRDQLGTIAVHLAQTAGDVRIHVRAPMEGGPPLVAMARVPATRRGLLPLRMRRATPPDVDDDGVPDEIDDCPAAADPDQTGCPEQDVASPGRGPAEREPGPEPQGAERPPEAPVGSPSDGGASAEPPAPDAGVERPARDAGVERPAPDVRVERPAPDAGPDRGGDLPPALYADGQACVAGAECRSGHCVDGVCCGAAACGPCEACNLTGRLGVCALLPSLAEDDFPRGACVAPLACNGAGLCRRTVGTVCAAGSECLSGFCVDGVCCAAACGDPCRSCASGQCVVVRRADDPPQCSGANTCNAQGRCAARDD